MIYRSENELSGRMNRKLRCAVKKLRGYCGLLAENAEALEYETNAFIVSMRGHVWGDLIDEIRAEALAVLEMCGRAEVLLDEGAGACHI